MRLTSIVKLGALLALFVSVIAETSPPPSVLSQTDADSNPSEPETIEEQRVLERNCRSLTSTKSKFKDPKFYWRILADIFRRKPVKPELVVHFYLFTREFRDCGEEVRVDDDSVLKSGFNASHPTRILIHGWLSQSNAEFSRSVKDAYLKIGDFNVIVIDWSMASHTINYYKAAKLVEDVGEIVANFAKHLKSTMGVDYDNVYLIGHSLGAHIAGSAGKRIQPDKFNTIFALDPAGPAFRGKPMDSVIDETDAKYVESIQTSDSLGVGQPVGHATFFPNKGIYQGCLVYGCAHRRSYKYFAESLISTRGFWGTICHKKLLMWSCPGKGDEYRMGGEPSLPKNGTFYVKTESNPPYAMGRMGTYLYA